MGQERRLRVAGENPDAAVDNALLFVGDWERAGFRLHDYTWTRRVAAGDSAIELVFEGADDLSTPRQRTIPTVERDDPTAVPKLVFVLVIALLVLLFAFRIYLAWDENRRATEMICALPDAAQDYPGRCP